MFYILIVNVKVDIGVLFNYFFVIKLIFLIEFVFVFCLIVVDVDECVSFDNNDCYFKVFCINIEGFYVCWCLRGYSGDGKNCLGKFLFLVGWNVKYFCI